MATTNSDNTMNPAGRRRRRLVLLTVATLGLLLAVPAAASAATFTVTRLDDPVPDVCSVGDCSLREAVQAADANGFASPDEIVFTAGLNGTILLSAAAGATEADTNADLDLIVPNVTITGNGQANTIVDAAGASRIFDIRLGTSDAGTITIEQLTITNGSGAASFPDDNGGGAGINFEGSEGDDTLNLTATTITDNSIGPNGTAGAGVRFVGDDGVDALNVANSTITDNVNEDGSGGGVSFSGGDGADTMDVTNSQLTDNLSIGGGAIEFSGDFFTSASGGIDRLTITDSAIDRNDATAQGGGGGGVSFRGGDAADVMTVTRSSISNNDAGNSGGGIDFRGDSSLDQSPGADSLVLTDSTVSGNTLVDGFGGGVAFSGGDGADGATFTRSTFADNVANFTGGGIDVFSGSATASNSTFVRNQAGTSSSNDTGGAISVRAGDTPARLTVTASTITDNTPDGLRSNDVPLDVLDSILGDNGSADCVATSVTANTTTFVSDSPSTCAGATVDPSATTLLGPLQVNAPGSTATRALLPLNPAIDAVFDIDCRVSTDQRGVLRPQGVGCDAGAYEIPIEIVVTNESVASVVRTWAWNVEKYASHARIVLARKKDPGAKVDKSHLGRFAKQATVDYGVVASAEAIDTEPVVTGTITVSVPLGALGAAEVILVENDQATITACDPAIPSEAAPVLLQPGEELVCDYSTGVLPNLNPLTNIAVAAARIPGDDSRSAVAADQVTADFDDPLVRGEIDRKARVYDSRAGFLGWVDAGSQPTVFTYSVLVAPGGLAPLCGSGRVNNTASVVGDDPESLVRDSVFVPVRVLCFVKVGSDSEKKTDSGSLVDLKPDDSGVSVDDRGRIDGIVNAEYPPVAEKTSCMSVRKAKRGSKRDPLWRMIGPEGRKTVFFNSNRSYAQAMVAKSKRRYFRLSRLYVRAKLNVHAGAPIAPRTTRALKFADRYFAETTPSARIGKKTKHAITRHMKTLKRFNKSARGYHPPVCGSK